MEPANEDEKKDGPIGAIMDGFLADNGKIAKVVLSGVSIAGTPVSPNIGSVISGDLIKQ
jgi:hypothetical protein